ncbi:MAG TPA: ATP-binding cassette domain-containing protein [Thermoanaerobaculia bacterium]|nr:ATP-binding cassette domain-containing protein [Thermoanaerobaculia bacterium]
MAHVFDNNDHMASSVVLEEVSVLSPAGDAIVDDLSLRIEPGQAVALVGRSGAGKTTILRLLNGLTVPRSGRVAIDDVELDGGDLSARRRRIGTILQAPALFPHRTVYDNVATVPRLLEWPEERIRSAAGEILERLGMPIDRFGRRFPRSLSGGEQQRIGIARAMIAGPTLLLCDEPFSALDPLVRHELQEEFVALRDRGGVTMLFVTHDLGEAVRVGRRIVLMERGAIVCDLRRDDFLRSDLPLVRQFIEASRLPEP